MWPEVMRNGKPRLIAQTGSVGIAVSGGVARLAANGGAGGYSQSPENPFGT